MKEIITVIYVGIISVLSSGCKDTPDDEPYPQQDPTGIWEGTRSDFPGRIYGVIWDGRWMIFPDIRSYTFQYEGNPEVIREALRGVFRYYWYHDLSSVNNITGRVFTKDEIFIKYHYEYTSATDINLWYQSSITEIGASLSHTNSNWSDERDTFAYTFSIDSNGLITGSDTSGCVYNGITTVPDVTINIYEVEVDVSMCGDRDGNYTGLAFFSSEMRDEFRFSISNPDHFISFAFARV